MGESFYITLSSNVNTEFFPENKLTHFFNRLQGPLNLHDKQWVVGLAEIQCPFNWQNIQEAEVSCTMYNVNTLKTKVIHVPAGHYTQCKHLIHFLNEKISQIQDRDFHRGAKFGQDRVSQKIIISAASNIILMFSDKLLRILGFREKRPPKIGKYYYGNDAVDIQDGVHHLYIYTMGITQPFSDHGESEKFL